MNRLIILILASGIFLSGCATNTITEENFSGFLNDYSILESSPDDPDALRYIAPNINWKQYNRIKVDDVQIKTPDGNIQVNDKLLVMIADKYTELLKKNLSKNFTIVDHAGTGVIRLQAAITGVFTSFDDLKGLQVIPIGAAITGFKRASNMEGKRVRVVSEGRLVDSVDGQLLLQAIDMKGSEEKLDANTDITLEDIMPVLEQWARRLAEGMVRLRETIRN